MRLNQARGKISSEGWASGVITLMFEPSTSYLSAPWWVGKRHYASCHFTYSVRLKLAPRWFLDPKLSLMDDLCGRLSQVGGLAGVARLLSENAGVQGELTENRNLTLTKRGTPRLI